MLLTAYGCLESTECCCCCCRCVKGAGSQACTAFSHPQLMYTAVCDQVLVLHSRARQFVGLPLQFVSLSRKLGRRLAGDKMAASELSKQVYELCRDQDAPGLRVSLWRHTEQTCEMEPISTCMRESRKTVDGSTTTLNAIGFAAYTESAECLWVLLDFGADVDNRDRRDE
jgi:hypothetical protein